MQKQKETICTVPHKQTIGLRRLTNWYGLWHLNILFSTEYLLLWWNHMRCFQALQWRIMQTWCFLQRYVNYFQPGRQSNISLAGSLYARGKCMHSIIILKVQWNRTPCKTSLYKKHRLTYSLKNLDLHLVDTTYIL